MKHEVRLLSALFACVSGASCVGQGGGQFGDEDGGSPTAPPSTGVSLPAVPTLDSAVGGADAVQLGFRAGDAGEVGLFLSATESLVYGGSPAVVGPAGDSVVVEGLAPGTYFAGLAVRPDPGDPWTPSGAVLVVQVAPPIYVDPAAAPGGDGTTPGTAFDNVLQAALVAGSLGGGNLWLAGGEYGPVSLPVLDGVHLSGGFGPDFTLAGRDPDATPTVVNGAGSQTIVTVLGQRAVLDGLVLDGGDDATIGVDSESAELDLRGVDVIDCTSRGIRVRAALDGDPTPVRVIGCTVSRNGADGLSAQGVLALEIVGSRFELNGQEGLDVDNLNAPSGGEASLAVRGCVFEANGSEGLDVDLATSPGALPPGGRFDVSIVDSVFVGNQLTGLLVDIDYEQNPEWVLDLEVLGIVARGNLEAGARFDLDSTARTFVHRSRFAANADEGLLVTSESTPGVAVVSASSFTQNVGAGARATFGNVPVLASHCVFSGNTGGGLVSDNVTSTAASSLFWLQPDPTAGVSEVGSGTAQSGDLENVARSFASVIGSGGAGVGLDSAADIDAGAAAEVGDDSVARTVLSVVGNTVALDPAPEALQIPGVLAAFAPGSSVVEDHRLTPGATVGGIGMGAPGAESVDPGPHGAPDAAEPGPSGPFAPAVLRVTSVTPAPVGPLAPGALVQIELDAPVLASSVDGQSVRVTDGAGATLPAGLSVVGGAIELVEPPGGWTSTVVVTLDRGLAGAAGEVPAPVRVVFGG